MVRVLPPDEIADLVRLMEGGDIDGAVSLVFDRSEATQALTTIRAEFARGVAEVTQRIQRDLTLVGIRVIMPISSPALIDRVRTWEDTAFRRVNEELRAGLRETIATELQRGIGPRQVAVALKGPISPVGLTAYDVRIVQSFRAALEDGRYRDALQRALRDRRSDRALTARLTNGKPLTKQQIDTMVAAYQRKLVAFRAETFARTAAIQAANDATQASWLEAVAQGQVPEDEVRRYWIVSDDERLCKTCEPIPRLNPEGVGLRQPFVTPLGPRMGPTMHPNCVLGDTPITASPAIHAVTQRLYEGPVVVIETAAGKRLRCTPNHPVLTGGGWVAAGALNVGDDVVRYLGRDRVPLVDHDHQHVEPHIEQIAEAARRARGMLAVEVPLSAEDFHGDGMGSEVAVVWTNGQLRDDVEPALLQQAPERHLVVAHAGAVRLPSEGAADLLGHAGRPALGGGVRLGKLHPPSLGVSDTAPLDALGLGTAPHVEAHTLQASNDRGSGNAEVCGHREHRLATLVSAPDLINVDGQRPYAPRFFETPANRDATAAQEVSDSLVADAMLAGELLEGRAGEVALDQIIRIERVEASCHVFNLETEEGWYAADGIITHNCRCTIWIERERAGVRRAPAPGSTRFVFA